MHMLCSSIRATLLGPPGMRMHRRTRSQAHTPGCVGLSAMRAPRRERSRACLPSCYTHSCARKLQGVTRASKMCTLQDALSLA